MLSKIDTPPVKDYVHDILGLKVVFEELPRSATAPLPFYLKNDYRYAKVYLEEVGIVMALAKGELNVPPGQLKKQHEMMERLLQAKVFFAFGQVEAYQRKRLVQNRIPFLVPGKQMYLPFLYLDFNETLKVAVPNRETLRPAAQCLLLYHLVMEHLGGTNFKQIACKLHYTNMTISRATQELVAIGLAEVVGNREKELVFPLAGKSLWERGKSFLLSPVKEAKYVSELPSAGKLYKAGLTALEAYSDLAGEQRTYALSSEDFRLLKQRGLLKDENQMEGEYRLESWSYAPGLLTSTDRVDRLSLFLSLRDTEDERVGLALEQMIDAVKW